MILLVYSKLSMFIRDEILANLFCVLLSEDKSILCLTFVQAKMSDKQITYTDIYQDLITQSLFLDNLKQI